MITPITRLLLLAVVLVGWAAPSTLGQAACDRWKDCLGRAVELSVTSGRDHHFIEVDGQVTAPRQTALTVEMWVKAERQPGKRVFLGGLWGPNNDANDQWVLYINEADQLSFEVNAELTDLKDIDNTIARVPYTPYYDTWTHVAAVFDGATQSVALYVQGILVAGPLSNPAYPVQWLRPMERNDLQTRIGSINGLADNATVYRALKGMVDEVRMWSRALTANEILCGQESSINAPQPGLTLYYRCNEPVNNINPICDATGNGHTGQLRSGAINKNAGRTLPRYVVVSPSSITQELYCDSTATWTFTIQDTSICGSSVTTRMRGPESAAFTVTPRNLTLVPGQPQTITVTYNGTNVGTFENELQVLPTNRCGYTQNIKLTLTRTTEVSVSRSTIAFDTLLVGCRDVTSHDSTITICNTTDQLGRPRVVTIRSISGSNPRAYRVMNANFPMQLQPGQCTTLVVRSFVMDTTDDYIDTLRVVSDDQCQSRPFTIAISGRTQEVISIRSSDGSRRIDTMSFSPTCPGQLSSPAYYTWQNLTLTDIQIDSIYVPADFTHYRVGLPFLLKPKTGYPPIAVRFRPRNPGNVFDSILIRTVARGCQIERVIYVRGRGLDNKVEWEQQGPIDVGDVIVGQQRTVNVVAHNRSPYDALRVALYVERGEAFTLLAGTGRTIAPMSSVSIPVTFRPTDSIEYVDRLCLFETRCYTVDCIELRGRGVLETFRFSPLVTETENVIACRSGLDTFCIVNISGAAQTISQLNFSNPSGRYALVDPPSLPAQITIPAGDSTCFVVEYTPNDLTNDRADRAYLQYKATGGIDWQIQLIGSSATPKLFVTQRTAYGTVEVGDTRTETLIVENTSSLPVTLDSLTIGGGYTIVGTTRPLPTILAPRDSLAVIVEFRPTAAQPYNTTLVAHSNDPCAITGTGVLEGRGVIIELENAITLVNFGYVRPCECSERTIELLNASQVFGMQIDSLWIDAQGIPAGKPEFFTWTSTNSPTGTVPYTIPAQSRDTVTVRFCPNTPADSTSTLVEALLHVKASGSGWSRELETYLYGKRSLTFTPWPRLVQFPSGVIDVLSPAARNVDLRIPGFNVNPSQDPVTIDSITFEPDERVFFVTQPAVFPFTINPGEVVRLELRQRPRAPRNYEARMVIHYSDPCVGRDTTVLVRGSGFAQPRGLAFSFDPQRALPDTFSMVSCDTLLVPIYSSIVIDASVVDVMMRVDFDTTQLRLLDVQSPLLQNTCTSATGGIVYTPSIQTAPSVRGGVDVLMKNFCGIDSLSAFGILRFVTVANNRVDSRVVIDSINFDTEDVILYKLIATGDRGRVLGYLSEVDVVPPPPFDSVRILDCREQVIVVRNVGDVAHTVDSLLDLPVNTTIVGIVPPVGDSIAPGDSALITVRFCPRSEDSVGSAPIAVSTSPCDTRDTSAITGFGYAPELPVAVAVTPTFFRIDTVGGTIGDTIELPVMLDRDLSATYNGTTYWLEGLSFAMQVRYAVRSLQYLDAPYLAQPAAMSVDQPAVGTVVIQVQGADSVRSGTLARLRFLVTVPEFAQTDVSVTAAGFVSDSLQFLDIVPSGSATPFVTAGECRLTVLTFSTPAPSSIRVVPHPVQDDATVRFTMQETVPVTLELMDMHGMVVRTLLDGSQRLQGGEYQAEFSTRDLPSAVYYLRIAAGVFSSTIPVVVVH